MRHTVSIAPLLATTVLFAGPAWAHDSSIHTKLESFQEVPALSSAASGRFKAKIDERANLITYELSYEGFETPVLQAHIHFGQKSVNGGISVFLCTNLNNSPGTQACPTPQGTITGTISPDNVIGPAGQGISAGEFEELLDAIRADVTYVNVHSMAFPGGEIRGQIK